MLGETAIAALADKARADDPAASSHWRRYHEGFSFEHGRLSGLRGFGGDNGPASLLSRAAHWALQTPYRGQARDFRAFAECERLAAELVARQGRRLDLEVLRQAISLALLLEKVPAAAFEKPVVVIGDGFGTLSSLILLRFPSARVVAVNLSKTLLVDLLYASRGVPSLTFGLAASASDLADGGPRLIGVPADSCELLRGTPIGVAVNVASMQEMDPPVVARYFELLRSGPERTWFYCCNRELKVLPDGTRVAFAEYPWDAADEVALDELCPWHQRWYKPVPPFYFPYDGPVRHRLARLARRP